MARTFDQANSEGLYVDSTPVTGSPLTMACWAKFVNTDDFEALVFIGDKDVEDEAYYLYVRGDLADEVIFRARVTGVNSDAEATDTYSSGTWEHFCGVRSAVDAGACYLNGGNKGTVATEAIPAGADRIAIGYAGDSSPSGYHDGEIAEVAVWNVALTDAQVLLLSKGFSPLFVQPQNLVAYWPLVRSLNDKVGGYNLTAFSGNSGPTVSAHPRIIYPAAPYTTISPAIAREYQAITPRLLGRPSRRIHANNFG